MATCPPSPPRSLRKSVVQTAESSRAPIAPQEPTTSQEGETEAITAIQDVVRLSSPSVRTKTASVPWFVTAIPTDTRTRSRRSLAPPMSPTLVVIRTGTPVLTTSRRNRSTGDTPRIGLSTTGIPIAQVECKATGTLSLIGGSGLKAKTSLVAAVVLPVTRNVVNRLPAALKPATATESSDRRANALSTR